MSTKQKTQSSVQQNKKSNQIASSPFNAPVRIKILSIGSLGCGKSCIIKRFCEERFINKYIPTIGVDYGVKPANVDGIDVKVNFWDLSGHTEFFEIRNEFYKDAQVYDVTLKESFHECDSWISEGNKFGLNTKELPVAVCANKIDRFQNRVISEEEGKQYAISRGFQYFETSAYTGDGINEMFQFLFQNSVKKMVSI